MQREERGPDMRGCPGQQPELAVAVEGVALVGGLRQDASDVGFERPPDLVELPVAGCRLGEALGLRWKDVDHARGELHFTQTVGRLDGRDLWGGTKNESSDRTFPLTGGVRSALAAQKSAQDLGLTGAPPSLLIVDGKPHGPLVFTAIDGGALSPSYVTHHFQKLLAAAGIERLRVHDLRHANASALRDAGVPVEEISRLLGHSSVAVTQAIYIHLFDESKLAAASKLDHLFADTGS
jgi:integrase